MNTKGGTIDTFLPGLSFRPRRMEGEIFFQSFCPPVGGLFQNLPIFKQIPKLVRDDIIKLI